MTEETRTMTICALAIPEMGHFLPIMQIAEELASRGHTVHVVTLCYFKEKCQKMIEDAGCIPKFTDENLKREDIMPSKDYPFGNPLVYKPHGKMVRQYLDEVKPDVCVADALEIFSLFAVDDAGVPLVIN